MTAIIDSSADHIHVKDPQGHYVLVNRADAAWFGRPADEILGRTDADLIGGVEAVRVRERDRRVMESGEALEYEEVVTIDGVTRTWLTTKSVVHDPRGEVIGLFTVAHEITDQRRQEEQLRQAAKMEAVGQLAGGIAHDFNNILTTIRGYTELVRTSVAEGDEQTHADLSQVLQAADRAAELTRQLLTFSRREVLAPRVLDAAQVVTAMAPMLRRVLGEHIDLVVRGTPDGRLVRVDPSQLEQVVLNLAINARDAMPDGGLLHIEVASVDLDETYVADHPGATVGPHVRLTVTDTGHGMDAVTLARIFEPFFTTKEPSKGTGLGLATVYGVMAQAGGSVHVESEPGTGSTFHASFPAVDEESSNELGRDAIEAPPVGIETVLLVEDERAVRTFARRLLTNLGYEVIEASSGAEALELSEGRPDIDLLLTDVIMPGMQGAALSAILTAARPDLRTLFISGFPEDSIVRKGVLAGDVAYLAKPFSAAALARAVRSTIDAYPAAATR